MKYIQKIKNKKNNDNDINNHYNKKQTTININHNYNTDKKQQLQ